MASRYILCPSSLPCFRDGRYTGATRSTAAGGTLTQFLLGLALPDDGTGKKRWASFCTVGSGLTAVQGAWVQRRLEECGGLVAAPPPCYKITGASKERPDLWVADPSGSVVLQIQGDLRLIRSET